MIDEIYLEPCPFCGGKAEFVRKGTPRYSTYVRCTDCGCGLESNENFDHGATWNTRADTADAAVAAAYERAAIYHDYHASKYCRTGNKVDAAAHDQHAKVIRALATDTQTDALELVRKEADRAGYERLRAKADKLAGAVNQYVRKHNATAFRTADYHENCDCLRCLFDRMSAALTELENTDDQNT